MHVASDMHPRVHCLRHYYAPLDKQVEVQKKFLALRVDINFIAPPTQNILPAPLMDSALVRLKPVNFTLQQIAY